MQGMYGINHRFVPLSQNLQEADWRYLVRVLTKEHVDCIAECGMMDVLPCNCDVDRKILSGLRLCSHPLRPRLVAELKRTGVVDAEFPKLGDRYPVPGTCSFTSPSNFAKVYRTFCERLWKSWFPSNVACVIIDTYRLDHIGIGHFRTREEADVLATELQQILPPSFALTESWMDDIRRTSATLMESHIYESVNVAHLMEVGSASILFFGMLAPEVKRGLSMAAYQKVFERKPDYICSPDVQKHSDILYPALATALESVPVYGRHMVDAMKLMKLSVGLEVEILTYCFVERQHRLRLRRQARLKRIIRVSCLLALIFVFRGRRRLQRMILNRQNA